MLGIEGFRCFLSCGILKKEEVRSLRSLELPSGLLRIREVCVFEDFESIEQKVELVTSEVFLSCRTIGQ